MFIGPTCQSPRVDEARNDALYELEIGLQPDPRQRRASAMDWSTAYSGTCSWTSPATPTAPEFCIDKLFSPGGGSGRLGLLELRAFEMPPHDRMSLAQQLLLRALIAEFWENPYRAGPRALGDGITRPLPPAPLCLAGFSGRDRRPQRLRLSIQGRMVCAASGVPFPDHRPDSIPRDQPGGPQTRSEPWHVLGEEGYIGGTVRYVDIVTRARAGEGHRPHRPATSDPLQRPPRAAASDRHSGRVRRRSALSRLAAAHVPAPHHRRALPRLVFDLIDTWTKKALGGCIYHVAHPGGRSYATLPVNAYEGRKPAASRVPRRMGHTPGASGEPLPTTKSAEFPFAARYAGIYESLTIFPATTPSYWRFDPSYETNRSTWPLRLPHRGLILATSLSRGRIRRRQTRLAACWAEAPAKKEGCEGRNSAMSRSR